MDGYSAFTCKAFWMVEVRRNWTESEIAEAIDLYLRTPFGRIHSRNPEIVELAQRLGRTPGSIALKLTNLAGIDDTLDRKGMSNHSKLDKIVWNEYLSALATEAAELPTLLDQDRYSGLTEIPQRSYQLDYKGKSIRRIVNVRQGQQFFRTMILASYSSKCAITGIAQPEFLVAGHIRSWASDPANRMNPRNGICLNRSHDKAFEDGLITVSADWRILYSSRLEPTARRKMEEIEESGSFRLPARFRPEPMFLEEHRDVRFQS